MLVLERHLDQTIKIGDDVTLVVLAINGAQIKFGIEAPRSVAVNRSEIQDKIQSHLKDDNIAALVIGDGNCSDMKRGEQ